MKKYSKKCNPDVQIYIGETEEIKATYKSIARNRNTNIRPLFSGSPKYSENKRVYGLHIDANNNMNIFTSDTFALLLLEGELIECS